MKQNYTKLPNNENLELITKNERNKTNLQAQVYPMGYLELQKSARNLEKFRSTPILNIKIR